MKILLVKSYPKLTSLGYLVQGLKKRGHDVHLLVPENHPDCKKVSRLGINVHIINFRTPELMDFNNKKIALSTFNKIVKLLDKNRFDIINLNLLSSHFVGKLASFVSKESIIISTVRGFEKNYKNLINGFDDAIVAVSGSVKQYLMSKGISEHSIEVIHNGIDLQKIDAIKNDKFYLHKELDLNSNIKLVGMVAYFYDSINKGHKVFLDAAKIISKKFTNVRFVLVGSDVFIKNTKKYFQSYSSKLGIKDKVYFLGERDDVLALMSSFYLHVLPSFSEGCPTVLIEAMARRVANVASKIKSIEELVADKKTGILFKPGDHKSLSNIISELLANPKRVKEMGHAGKKRAEKYFKVEDMVLKYDKLFKKLAKNKGINHARQ